MIICHNDDLKDAPSTDSEGKSQTHQTNFWHQCLLLFRSWSQWCVLLVPTWFTSRPLWLLPTVQSQISPAWHQGHQYEFIPPWKLYEKHRPGTVVLIPQIYQVNRHSMCVLANSTEAVKIPPIPILHATQGAAASGLGSNSPVKSTQAFTSFQSPSKKRKMDM